MFVRCVVVAKLLPSHRRLSALKFCTFACVARQAERALDPLVVLPVHAYSLYHLALGNPEHSRSLALYCHTARLTCWLVPFPGRFPLICAQSLRCAMAASLSRAHALIPGAVLSFSCVFCLPCLVCPCVVAVLTDLRCWSTLCRARRDAAGCRSLLTIAAG